MWAGIAQSVLATRYELEGPGIESRWGRETIQTGHGAHPASCVMSTGCFSGVKRPGRGVEHPPPSSAYVKESVELYLCAPPWAFVVCSKVNFTLLLSNMLHLDDSVYSVILQAIVAVGGCVRSYCGVRYVKSLVTAAFYTRCRSRGYLTSSVL
jgi:hypothetical protein